MRHVNKNSRCGTVKGKCYCYRIDSSVWFQHGTEKHQENQMFGKDVHDITVRINTSVCPDYLCAGQRDKQMLDNHAKDVAAKDFARSE